MDAHGRADLRPLPTGDRGMTGSQPVLHACTIVSKNYLSYARVLARSFLDHHPGGRFFVLLVDRIDGHFDASAEPFELIEIETLKNIAYVKALLFKYTVLEANTAVKPFFLEHLLATEELDRLLYLDPDILVLRPLDHLSDVLDQQAIALTPHLTAPIEDDAFPDELAILRSGTYNLGFIGLARRDPVDQFLTWWQGRVLDRCVVRVEEGLFVDQKWIDLVPGFYPNVGIIHHPGYNVAYWNLHCRHVETGGMADGGDVRVNGEPLAFFHFSGLQPELPEIVSKHQNRFRLGDLGNVRYLFERYISLLRNAGLSETCTWPYAFERFDNGVAIPNLARAQYLSLGSDRSRFGDPFATGGEDSYWRWMNRSARRRTPPFLSRLLFYLWETQRELQIAYPDPGGGDLDRLAEWINVYGKQTYALPDEVLTALGALQQQRSSPLATARRTAKRLLKQTYESPPARAGKDWIKQHLGADRTRGVKRLLTPLATGHAAASAVAGPNAQQPDLSRAGINVVGYIRTESGMGEGARSIVRAAEAVGLSHSVSNVSHNVVSRMDDRTVGVRPDAPDYGINIFVINADQVPAVAKDIGDARFRAHYNVGAWVWEQDRFPTAWVSAFGYFDEIWTPSRFSLDALSTVSPLPVRRMPHLVDITPNPGASRETFDLAADQFVFLFIFDYLSYVDRKNPLGVARAFGRAFASDEPVTLVLKCANSDFDPEAHAMLERDVTNHPRIRLIDRYLERAQVIDLMAVSDAYVSLHRSEGFGLTLAEAMCLGKPVIATQYSGNTDFMNPANSLPVGYRLTTLERDVGPYLKGTHWADPDLDQAANQMRRVYDDQDLGRRLGEQAASDIASQFGREAVGAILRDRVGDILRRDVGGGLTHPAR